MTLSPDRYRYQSIARQIAAQIEAGLFREGDRLPSVRSIVATHGVSVTTASRVLVELEAGGYADARPRSGFYATGAGRRSARDAPQATGTAAGPQPVDVNRLISEIFRAASASGGGAKLLALGAAELDETLLPGKELAAAVRLVLRESGAAILAYGHPQGEPALRRRIAHLMGNRGVAVSPEDIVITAGETDAMGIALRALARPGDTVAVESPCFFGILQWIETLGLKAVAIATDPRTGLDIGELERVAKATPLAAVVLTPAFHNPFGFAMPPERMTQLMETATGLNLPVIEDDVYGELHHGLKPARPLKSFDPDGRVIYCSSFSKTLAPGFRAGWCIPGRFADAVAAVRTPQNAGIGSLQQLALAKFLEGRGWSRHLEKLRSLFAAQRPKVRALVLASFPAGTKVSDPAGGFVFWVELPAPFDALAFHRRALDHGITIAPGPIFSAAGGFTNAFRLSAGGRLDARIERGIRRLGALAVDCAAGHNVFKL